MMPDWRALFAGPRAPQQRALQEGLEVLLRHGRDALQPDAVAMHAMNALIAAQGYRYAVHGRTRPRQAGEPLAVLLAGYNGTRNTGSDVRVHEIIRQWRHLLGEDRVALTVMTQHPDRTHGYFPGVRQAHLPAFYLPFLQQTCPANDVIMACEGSMFTSRFADALSTMMVGAMALGHADGALGVGYGGEAGRMSPPLRAFVRHHAPALQVFCRTQATRDALDELGVPTHPGEDTAWTFEPEPPHAGLDALHRAGWDGRQPLVIGCPVDPFCWPVVPDLRRALADWIHPDPADDPDHYRAFYYHRRHPDADNLRDRYEGAMATALRHAADRTGGFPILVAMEALDTTPARRVADRLHGAPCFSSLDHDMHTLVGILRRGHLLVSSRYHAMVCSMAAGVPSIGLSIDQRIPDLLALRGHGHLCLDADDPDAADRIVPRVDTALDDHGALHHATRAAILPALERMGSMGLALRRMVVARWSDLADALPPHTVDNTDPWAGLPPLGTTLTRTLEALA
jgi:polysaccharide pyruvyl transferase WcaK-like protein